MSDVFVGSGKQEQLAVRMKSLEIEESDLEEKFILGSGKGGQKVNKTSSCVFLRHKPSGLEVKCQLSRSRELNRFAARKALCDKVDEQVRGAASVRRQKAEKIRRQKRRRSRRQKQRMLEDKHRQSDKKKQRTQVNVSSGE